MYFRSEKYTFETKGWLPKRAFGGAALRQIILMTRDGQQGLQSSVRPLANSIEKENIRRNLATHFAEGFLLSFFSNLKGNSEKNSAF